MLLQKQAVMDAIDQDIQSFLSRFGKQQLISKIKYKITINIIFKIIHIII